MQKLKHLSWRRSISAVALVLFTLLVVRNWSNFVQSFNTIKNADIVWLFTASCGVALTYIAAAGGYIVVSIKKLSILYTLLAQVAAAFANKLLPSGVGGIGLNVAYMYKNKYTPAEAATIVAINSLAAFVSFGLLIIVALTNGGLTDSTITVPDIPIWVVVLIVILFLASVVTFLSNKKYRANLVGVIQQVVLTIKIYKYYPLRLLGAVAMATLVTFAYLIALYASARSLDVHIGLSEIFFVYVFGAIASAAIPTPGGLGAAEAALFAGFFSYSIEQSQALSVVLVYRFLTYWLPILPGYISFQYLQRKKVL